MFGGRSQKFAAYMVPQAIIPRDFFLFCGLASRPLINVGPIILSSARKIILVTKSLSMVQFFTDFLR